MAHCLWQAEADTELKLSASPTAAMGQKALALAKRSYSAETLSLNLIGTGEVVLALLDGNNSTEKYFIL